VREKGTVKAYEKASLQRGDCAEAAENLCDRNLRTRERGKENAEQDKNLKRKKSEKGIPEM